MRRDEFLYLSEPEFGSHQSKARGANKENNASEAGKRDKRREKERERLYYVED